MADVCNTPPFPGHNYVSNRFGVIEREKIAPVEIANRITSTSGSSSDIASLLTLSCASETALEAGRDQTSTRSANAPAHAPNVTSEASDGLLSPTTNNPGNDENIRDQSTSPPNSVVSPGSPTAPGTGGASAPTETDRGPALTSKRQIPQIPATDDKKDPRIAYGRGAPHPAVLAANNRLGRSALRQRYELYRALGLEKEARAYGPLCRRLQAPSGSAAIGADTGEHTFGVCGLNARVRGGAGGSSSSSLPAAGPTSAQSTTTLSTHEQQEQSQQGSGQLLPKGTRQPRQPFSTSKHGPTTDNKTSSKNFKGSSSYSRGSSDGRTNDQYASPQVVPRAAVSESQWHADTIACERCRKAFGLFRRRHHW